MHWILSRQFCTKLQKVIDEAKILSQISLSEQFSIDFHWQVILTADTPVLNNPGGIIFTSTDAGATFKFIQLPFHLAQPIVYHFLNPDYLVALSIDVSLLNFQSPLVVSVALFNIPGYHTDTHVYYPNKHTSGTLLNV